MFNEWIGRVDTAIEHFTMSAEACDKKSRGQLAIFNDTPDTRRAYAIIAKAYRKEVEKFKKAKQALKGI